MAGFVEEKGKSIILENKYARVVIAKEDALVESIFDKTDGKEIKAAEPMHFFWIVDANKEKVVPSGLAIEDGVITVRSALGSFCIKVEAQEEWFTLEVASKLPEECFKAILANAKYDYEPEDKNITGAVNVSLTDSVNPCFYPDAKSLETRGEVVRHLSDEGAKMALIIAPRTKHRDLLKAVFSTIDRTKGIVSSTGGVWSTEHEPNYGDYTIQSESAREYIENNLDYFKSIGVELIDFHQGGGTFRQGDFKFWKYDSAAEFKENVTDFLKENGILTGLHTYSAMVDYGASTILSDPKWQKDLQHTEDFTLSEDIDEKASLIPTVESTASVNCDFFFGSANTPYLLIGEELMKFSEASCGFKVIERGACGTKAVAHKKGEVVAIIGGRYNMMAPRAGSELFYQIARNTAKAFNEGGFHMIYFDAFEGFLKFCDSEEEGWYYAASFIREMLLHCDHDPLIEYSMMMPSLWAARGRIGAYDIQFRGFNTFNKFHAEENKKFLDRYNVATLGWYNYYPMEEGQPGNLHTKYYHREYVDYMGSLSLYYNYCTVYNGMTPAAMERCAALCRNVKRYQLYTKLRRSHYFSEETLKKARDGKWEYHVVDKGNGKYVFVEKDYQMKKLHDLSDSERNKAVYTNHFAAQTPFIRVEARLTTDGKNPMVLLPLDEDRDLISQGLVHKFSTRIDLENRYAMKVKVLGNGKKGGIVCIQLRSNLEGEPALGNFIIETDFEGWRDFILLESDTGDYPELPFYEGERFCSIFYGKLHYTALDSIEVKTAGDVSGVRMSSVTACECTYDVYKNPTVKIGDQSLMFECELMSTDFIEYDGTSAVVIDRYGNEKPVWFTGTANVPNGAFEAKVTARSLNRCVPRLRLTFGFSGEEIVT